MRKSSSLQWRADLLSNVCPALSSYLSLMNQQCLKSSKNLQHYDAVETNLTHALETFGSMIWFQLVCVGIFVIIIFDLADKNITII